MIDLEQAIELAQSDLKKTCYHEAAHQAVALHFGVNSYWRVSLAIDKESISYVGYCQLYTPMTGHNHRLVLLAGMVAEAFLADEAVESWYIFDLVEGYRSFGCSSDLEKAGDFTEQDIQDCLNIVKSHWPAIKQEADWQIYAMQEDVMTFANALLNNAEVNRD